MSVFGGAGGDKKRSPGRPIYIFFPQTFCLKGVTICPEQVPKSLKGRGDCLKLTFSDLKVYKSVC